MPLQQKTHPTTHFDFIKIVAASMILFSHHFALMGQSEPSFLDLYSLGGLALGIFSTISGHLVTNSWSRDHNLLHIAQIVKDMSGAALRRIRGAISRSLSLRPPNSAVGDSYRSAKGWTV